VRWIAGKHAGSKDRENGMYILQSVIIGAVVIHNELNHWTPNKVAASIIGIAAAYAATVILVGLRQLVARRRSPRAL
jgi:predicted phage tail protein